MLEENAGFLEVAREAAAKSIAITNSFNADQHLDADLTYSILP